MVIMSTSCARRSRSVPCTCSMVSPRPSMIPDLVGDVRVLRLELLQQRAATSRSRRPGARSRYRSRHRLEVVVEHVRRVGREDLQRALHAALAAEVRASGSRSWCAGCARGSRAMQSTKCWAPPSRRSSRSTRGDHDVLQAHVGDGASPGCSGSPASGGFGPAVGDVAERAAARADLAEDHEGRGAVAEALVDVRAAGFLAHRDQAVLAQLGLERWPPSCRTGCARGSTTACAAPARRRTAPASARSCRRRAASRPARSDAARRRADDGSGMVLAAESVMAQARRRRRAGRAARAAALRARRPNCAARCSSSTGLTASRLDGPPKSSIEVTCNPCVTAGIDAAERLQVHRDVEGQAVEGAAAAHADAERGDLGAVHVHAGRAVAARGVDVPVGQGVDDRLLDAVDVLAHADLQPFQVEQRVRPRSGRGRGRSPGRRGRRAAPGYRPASARARACRPGRG